MNITIEKATPTDAAALIEYLNQVGGQTENLTFGAEGLGFTVEEETEYLAGLTNSKDSIMLVAKENGKIVGNASLIRLPRRMNHRGDFSVTVLQSHWNQGIGGLLTQKIIKFAKESGLHIIDLQVRSDNLSAIHLYEKYGFEKIGTHKNFFKIGGEYFSADYMNLYL